ncbi:hypothetical protein GF108_14415 [Phyllobacterium sp. SYP-B3895]|uniref:DUF6894 family protein n=1 Tax=Phyllobacterium sp. SYP-B3895 TaxID=2663240 RepID=UPI001299A01E|nr:hypothetical protein [Phyllobacterium sp. SYP-B3895]MRG56771.1 hypothetical protein [Phyllobacterium sp. SYP-B3895]
MPIFHFAYHEGDGLPIEVVEMECVDGEAALHAAAGAARDNIHEAVGRNIDPSKFLVHVYDDTNRLMGTMRISDVMTQPGG